MQEQPDIFSSLQQRNPQSQQFPLGGMKLLSDLGFFSSQRNVTPTHIYRIASHCTESAFVFSQFRGALDRLIEWCPHHPSLSKITTGEAFATLGISQLSTSHQHKAPTLMATPVEGGWRLQGFAPWVTGAHHADFFLLGAKNTLREHLLFWIPKRDVFLHPAWKLTALNACDTAKVSIDSVVSKDCLIHRTVSGATKTGSLRSAAMALGIAAQSLSIIKKQAQKRPALKQTEKNLQQQLQHFQEQLLHNVDRISYRFAVNQLALSSSQQALVATKGRGYLLSEQASTLCQQALFFLVWSCPESVQYKHLGIT